MHRQLTPLSPKNWCATAFRYSHFLTDENIRYGNFSRASTITKGHFRDITRILKIKYEGRRTVYMLRITAKGLFKCLPSYFRFCSKFNAKLNVIAQEHTSILVISILWKYNKTSAHRCTRQNETHLYPALRNDYLKSANRQYSAENLRLEIVKKC